MHDHDRAFRHDDHADAAPAPAPGKRTLTSAIQRKASGTAPPPAAAAEARGAPIDPAEPFWFAEGARPDGATIMRKASAEVRDASPDAQFAQATRGGAGEIPFRAEMEQCFGEDFSGVRAFFGRATELDGLGAHAATRDEHVAFADASPDRELVAHELVHVVQARRGGRGTGAVSSPHDAAEHEADAIAAKVARGEAVAVGGGAPAVVSRKGPCRTVSGSDALAKYGLAPGQPVFIEDDKLTPEGLISRAEDGGTVMARFFSSDGGWTRAPIPARLLAIDTYQVSPKSNPDDVGGGAMSKFVLQPRAISATDDHLFVEILSIGVNQWDRASWQIRLMAPSGQILNLAPDKRWWNNPAWDADEMQASSFGAYRFRKGFTHLPQHGDGERGTHRRIVAQLPLKTIQAFFKKHGGMTDISKIVVGMTVRYTEGYCPVTADTAEFEDAFGFAGQYHGEGIVRQNGDGTVDLSAVKAKLKLPAGERATDAEVWEQALPENPRPNLERDVTPEYVHDHPLMAPLVPKGRDGKEAPPQKLQTRIENEATLRLTDLGKLQDLILMLEYLCTKPAEVQKMMCPDDGHPLLGLFKWTLQREGDPLVFTDVYLDDPMFTALRSGVGIRKRSTTKATKLNVKTGEGYNVEGSDIYRRHEIGYDLDQDAQPEDIGAFLQSGVDGESDPWNKGGEEANRATRTAGNGVIDFAKLAARMVLKGHRSKFKLSAVDHSGGTINIELSCDHTVGRTFQNFLETEQLEEKPDPFKTFGPTYHHLYNLEMELEHLGAGGAQPSSPSIGNDPSGPSSSSMSEPQGMTSELPLAPLPKEPPVGHPGRMYLLKDTEAPQFDTPSFQVFHHAQRRFVEFARHEGLGERELEQDRQKLESIFEALAPSMDTGRPYTPKHQRPITDGPWRGAKGLRTPVMPDLSGCCYERLGKHRVITVVDAIVERLPRELVAGAQVRSLDGRTEYWFPAGPGPSQLWRQIQKLHQ